jgi:hypothetical protein
MMRAASSSRLKATSDRLLVWLENSCGLPATARMSSKRETMNMPDTGSL